MVFTHIDLECGIPLENGDYVEILDGRSGQSKGKFTGYLGGHSPVTGKLWNILPKKFADDFALVKFHTNGCCHVKRYVCQHGDHSGWRLEWRECGSFHDCLSQTPQLEDYQDPPIDRELW